jgi:hypothetical protein
MIKEETTCKKSWGASELQNWQIWEFYYVRLRVYVEVPFEEKAEENDIF